MHSRDLAGQRHHATSHFSDARGWWEDIEPRTAHVRCHIAHHLHTPNPPKAARVVVVVVVIVCVCVLFNRGTLRLRALNATQMVKATRICSKEDSSQKKDIKKKSKNRNRVRSDGGSSLAPTCRKCSSRKPLNLKSNSDCASGSPVVGGKNVTKATLCYAFERVFHIVGNTGSNFGVS